MLGSGALRLQEQLHEVLRPPVAGCPLPVLGPEGRLLLFGWWLLSWFFSFSRLSLGPRGFLHLELLVLDLVLVEGLLVRVELKPDDGLHFTNVALDCEELVHEAQLAAVVIPSQLGRVAETLKQNVALGRLTHTTESILDHLHD